MPIVHVDVTNYLAVYSNSLIANLINKKSLTHFQKLDQKSDQIANKRKSSDTLVW
jgi:hypothetical protein